MGVGVWEGVNRMGVEVWEGINRMGVGELGEGANGCVCPSGFAA
jgi:hypothetical protein